MKTNISHNLSWPKVIIITAAVLLAYDPLLWLIKTWIDPSYASSGLYLFIIVAGLFGWSFSSKRTALSNQQFPLILLFLSAIVRLVGQILAVNVLGAITLVVDLYAIAKIAGLDRRMRSISPLWLSLSFAFTLPLERILQRVFGYGLQNISADGACTVLGVIVNDVSCQGVRILINQQDVLVDLPCSGARAFLLLLFFFSVSACFFRLNLRNAFYGFLITVLSAYLINVIRICVLAIFIGFPNLIFNIDVMSQPTHDVIGLILLSFGVLPVALWARWKQTDNHASTPHLPSKLLHHGWWLKRTKTNINKSISALGFMGIAIVIISLPKEARDVSRKDLPIEIPMNLGGDFAVPQELLPKEQLYFTQYGGSAKKAQYADRSLMVVKTSAPLRHLHAPDDCLRGLGMDVEYRGVHYSPIPTAIYKATDEQGAEYRVAVTFISSTEKYMTTNISEAIWYWLKNPDEDWMAIQRITHWDSDPTKNNEFDYAVMASFELPHAVFAFNQKNGE